MKTIWARVGMTVEVTDEEYEMLREMARNDSMTEACGYDVYDDLDVFPSWFNKRLENGTGSIDGDSYIPSDCWLGIKEDIE